MTQVSINSVITPHPAPQVDLTDEPPPLEKAPIPEEPIVDSKPPPTPTKAAKIDSDIFCNAVPPLPPGWGMLEPMEPELPPPAPPIISVGELAMALGVTLGMGIVFGGGLAYLLSKPKLVCETRA